MINKNEYIDLKQLSKNLDDVISDESKILSDNLTLEEFNALQSIQNEEESYSSEEVKKILFTRDVFAKNGVIIDDLDVFKNILNWLKLWKNLI